MPLGCHQGGLDSILMLSTNCPRKDSRLALDIPSEEPKSSSSMSSRKMSLGAATAYLEVPAVVFPVVSLAFSVVSL